MELACEITKKEADKIGNITIDGTIVFTPYFMETERGTYIITKAKYDVWKDRGGLKNVDFSSKEWVDIKTII